MKLFNWLKNNVLGNLIAGLLLIPIPMYFNLPKEQRGNFFSFSWIGKALTVNVPLWISLCLMGVIWLSWKLRSEYLKNKKYKDVQQTQPPLYQYLNYKSDVFGKSNSFWSWDYHWDLRGRRYTIIELSPNCPICSDKMRFTNPSHVEARCSNCALNGKFEFHTVNEKIEDIERAILSRIENRKSTTIT